MSNLNSLSNNNTFNKKNVSLKSKSGGKYQNLVGILIAVVAFIIIIVVLHNLRKTYQANKITGKETVVLEKYAFDCKDNHKIIDDGMMPKSVIGNEYNLSFWIYINNLNFNFTNDKNIIVKGDITKHLEDENIPPAIVNPRIYLAKESNKMVFDFEVDHILDPDEGCYEGYDLFSPTGVIEDVTFITKRSGPPLEPEEISAGGTGGKGATFDITIKEGKIEKIMVNKQGSGFAEGDQIHIDERNVNATVEGGAWSITLIKDDLTGNKLKKKNLMERYSAKKDEITGARVPVISAKKGEITGTLAPVILTTQEDLLKTVCQSKYASDDYDYYALAMPSKNADDIILSKCIGLSQEEIEKLKKDGMKKDKKNCQSTTITGASPEKPHPDNTLGSDTHMFVHRSRNKNSSKTEIENIPLQKWNFVSINVHNNYCDVFFNDELKASTEFQGSIRPNSYPLMLGAISTKGEAGFDGYLSSVTYTNYALTKNDIIGGNSLYSNGPKIMKGFKDTIKGFF